MLKKLQDFLARRGPRSTADEPTAPRENQRSSDEGAAVQPLPPVHVGPKIIHRPIPVTDLDQDAVKIVQRLTRFDHSAYLVGGCVRDLLLDRKPKDFDIGTSATPRQIKRLFRNSRIIGRRFRLAHIYFQQGKIIEVATFRSREEDDPETPEDDLLIKDDNVFGTAEEDALRRDFTINSLFYDLNTETVLDHCGGLDDLRRRVVRTIGDPRIRFLEDPIRILRAIKFAARLDFDIEPITLESLKSARSEIDKAAPPRVLEEINRFCQGGAAGQSFRLLQETGVFEIILPEFHDLYEAMPSCRDFLYELLRRFDARVEKDQEIGTGEIVAALLLPVVRERIGWKEDGRAVRPRGTNIRELTDAIVKPAAVRLRISRKDQEQCRQIMMSLYRMIPVKNVRPNTRRMILGNDAFPQALSILEGTAERLGGEFSEAVEYWKKAHSEPPATAKAPTTEKKTTRRKKRRRPRTKIAEGKPEERARKAPPERQSSRKDKSREMPPPWDDNYFFAALPTVPHGKVSGKPSAGPDSSSPAAADEPTEETGDAATSAGKKRRRRRRRRKPPGD